MTAKTTVKTIRFKNEELQELMDSAEEMNLSFSSFIRYIIKLGYAEHISKWKGVSV